MPKDTPKHQVVKEHLRSQIHKGVYPPGTQLPPESQLPSLLKVGKHTIRHAMSDLVREGLIVRRKGLGSFVTENRHRPNLPNRPLKLGILWHQSVLPERMKGEFQGTLTLGMIEALGLTDIEPSWSMVDPDQITRVSWTDPARNLQVEVLGEARVGHPRHPPMEAVRSGNYDGLLILSIIEETFLEELISLGAPAVFVDVLNERFLDEADQVFVDPFPGYQQAVRYFASRGCTRIHFVPGYVGMPHIGEESTETEREAYRRRPMRVDPDSYLRLSAFRQGMEECGLPVPEEYLHFTDDPIHHLENLEKKVLALAPDQRPQAVIAHSFSQVEQLRKAAARAGWSLEGAGAGSGPWRNAPSAAKSIRINGAAMGEIAVELLAARLQRPERPCLRVGVPLRFQPNGDPKRRSARENVVASSSSGNTNK